MNRTSRDIELEGQAAVLLAICGRESGQKLLLTKRSEQLSIHRGEVAFPGGKWEGGDKNLLATALRESEEEVGLAKHAVDVIGQLAPCSTRAGMLVTPYIGMVSEQVDLKPNREELDSLFWVPVDFLIKDRRERTDIFKLPGGEEWAPVYQWEGYKIWGFTARVIVNFLNEYVGLNISRENSAEEQEYHYQQR